MSGLYLNHAPIPPPSKPTVAVDRIDNTGIYQINSNALVDRVDISGIYKSTAETRVDRVDMATLLKVHATARVDRVVLAVLISTESFVVYKTGINAGRKPRLRR